ncbi:MAG TPA: ATP-binding cassette domain-containing protein, partial [Blastocatellia bacterium]|nr:ATP-binding cassette domain-containing protein [Blastocatellia bacterium]
GCVPMSIILDRITKRYGGHHVVDKVSLEVTDGELFVLLGASGSGKSTILRMIAGLIQPDSGRILLHERDVTNVPPQKRDIGLVFQNYSIFQHMSVAENIEFGLRIRKRPKSERKARREELLDLVGLAGLGNRLPSQLSGGQQQRVAVARALAYEPAVLLLDEPFGALDVKIRTQLRRSLKEIQKKLGVTTILVTHDQEEAFELADRIAVLERGRLLEIGTGEELYARPKTLFVATFLGAGTVIVGRAEAGKAHFGPICLPIPDEVSHEDGAQVQILFRPEQVVLSEEEPSRKHTAIGQGAVIEESFNGSSRRIRLRLPHLPAARQIAPPLPFGEEGLLVDAIVPADQPLTNRKAWVSLRGWHILAPPAARLLVLDSGSGTAAPLQVAKQLVDRLGASVTLLAVADNPDEAEALRQTVVSRQKESTLSEAEVQIRYGEWAEQIIAEQSDMLYEMLVLAPRQKRFSIPDPRTDGLGSATAKVLQQSSVPVLVVKGEREIISKILICTAAGEPGKTDVQVGGRLARRLGAAVTLLYVNIGWADASQIAHAHLEAAAATLRSLDIKSDIRIQNAETPAAGILQKAREGDYDIIVVGGHGPRLGSIFKLSNITSQVVAGADRLVLVVPATGNGF